MKNYIYILILSIVVFSCSKEDNYLFDKSPDERITEALSNYENIFTGSENGWILALETGLSGGYDHWVKFDKNNRVLMLSDADATTTQYGNTSTDVIESSYRLKSVITPILMFDTYSYIHMLADPNNNVNGGSAGYGLKTDFEFSLGDYDETTHTLSMKGRYNGKKAVMMQCSSDEYNKIKEGSLKQMHKDFSSYVSKLYKYPVLDIGTNKVDVIISSRNVSLKFIDSKDEISTASTAAYLDLASLSGKQPISNIHFFNPINYNDKTFNELLYEDGKLYAIIDNQKCYVVENGKPAIPFRFGYKKDFSQMRVNADQLTNTLQDPFLSNVYLAAKTKLYGNGKRNMQYVNISFGMSSITGKPAMILTIRYNNTAGSNYNANWHFSYVVNDDGTITFTDRDQTGSSNERGQEPHLKPIVDYFCTFEYSSYSTSSSWAMNKKNVTKTIPHTFKIDWIDNNTPGLSSSIGGFIPVDATQLTNSGICCGVVSK